MENMSPKTVLILVVVGIAIVGGILLYSSGSLPQQQANQEQQGETVAEPEIKSIAGRVTSVNAEENSFVLLQVKEERSFTVRLGEETEFVRLVFPFDLNNPAGEDVEVSFTPEREVVTIEDLQVDDQVFVRSETAVKTGQDIESPLEIQILP